MSAPDRIWVEDCSGEWLDDTGSWSVDRENDHDVQYARSDLVPQWMAIDTAPKDGSFFLGYWPDPTGGNAETPVKTCWGPKFKAEKKSGWHNPYEFAFEDNDYAPTHWMPLPTPPSA